jgi:UDP-glucuronate 4-epimerase
MAIFLFTKAIVKGMPIGLFNHGKMRRDFTYIDDVTRIVSRLVDWVPKGGRGSRTVRRRDSTMSVTSIRKNSRIW